jgi:hypothetical protein
MKAKFYVLVGALLVGWLCYEIYKVSGRTFFLYAGTIAVILSVINLVLGGVRPEEGGFLDAAFGKLTQADYDALYKEPKKDSEAETRAWYNKEESARAWYAESDSYIDYDGYKRNTNTHERMYMNPKDKGNGKNKRY